MAFFMNISVKELLRTKLLDNLLLILQPYNQDSLRLYCPEGVHKTHAGRPATIASRTFIRLFLVNYGKMSTDQNDMPSRFFTSSHLSISGWEQCDYFSYKHQGRILPTMLFFLWSAMKSYHYYEEHFLILQNFIPLRLWHALFHKKKFHIYATALKTASELAWAWDCMFAKTQLGVVKLGADLFFFAALKWLF